ncbi:hypothetical protein E2562_019831 [Oryza meyeriana var. granulata]|uniref:Endonuclease/exonuclease/phosphatase domain-containing protein n=1 Tax=Oryza meyeriana var. granulata TaxID=110450 RepID=A0A6G1CS41_9ORYZ|nr:hypothetical protein E2562_019831 [Oryza meyeriana var. granulata]
MVPRQSASRGPRWPVVASGDMNECPDLLRSATVYTEWSVAVSEVCCLRVAATHQTPCLIYAPDFAVPSAVGMYGLSEGRAYTIPITERHWISSSHGWLITDDRRSELILLNPITVR